MTHEDKSHVSTSEGNSHADGAPMPNVGAGQMVRFDFGGSPRAIYSFRGKACMIAAEAGLALGYGENGKLLVTMMRRDWADELIEGRDYEVLTGQNLADFKAVWGDAEGSSASKTNRLTILYEPGLWAVCLLSKKPAGKQLRRQLADEVLPQLARTGRYEPAPAAPVIDAATLARLERLETMALSIPDVVNAALANRPPIHVNVSLASEPIGVAAANRLLDDIAHYAILMTWGNPYQTDRERINRLRSWRTRGENDLRAHLRFQGSGRPMWKLPKEAHEEAQRKVFEMLRTAQAAHSERFVGAPKPLRPTRKVK